MLVRRPRGSSTGSGGGGLARLAEARLELCPIDHGFCLPEGLEPPYFEWLHWPQVRFPRPSHVRLAQNCCMHDRPSCGVYLSIKTLPSRENLHGCPQYSKRTGPICFLLSLERSVVDSCSLNMLSSGESLLKGV